MDRLTVLGGGGPFTASLIDALAQSGSAVGPQELVLHGRGGESLDLVLGYADRVLGSAGWKVEASTDLRASLVGATVVLHQVRYGGLDGRAADECSALRFGVQPDETLGPAALECLLRTRPGLLATCEALRANCPEAWILNLTNPLSVVTAMLTALVSKRCVGLCELPVVTATQAAEVLRLPLSALEWSYAGFNHRGFIVRLRADGKDKFGELVENLGSQDLALIRAEEIARLGAIPTKYFRLLDRPGPPSGGRAQELVNLRVRILDELRSEKSGSPPSLRERYMEWYPRSVVPMIASLRSQTPSEQIVNVKSAGGLVRELHARVCKGGIEPLPIPALEGEVAAWAERFERHESRLLDVARRPGRETIELALEADPIVPPGHVAKIAAELCQRYADDA